MSDTLYVPEVDENIALPASAIEAFPELSPHDELNMRARTIKLISDLSGQPLVPDLQQKEDATMLARAMIENPQLRPQFSKYPNETLAYLAGMVTQYNCQLVDDLAEFKNYVINKLVDEVEHSKTSKDRIAALRLLGEVDGIDAYKRRTEMTVQIKPIEEIEKELKSVIDSLEVRVISQHDEPINGTDVHSS